MSVKMSAMTEDYLNYPSLIDAAMRSMVRDVMRRVQAEGLPGEHHFYISYDTQFPGVRMSEHLHGKYPKDITIVLQHQFWDFRVEDAQFHVTLSFGGAPEKLTVPFAALTAFADPSIKFGLQFQAAQTEQSALPDTADLQVEEDEDGEAAAEIISLDAFRKK